MPKNKKSSELPSNCYGLKSGTVIKANQNLTFLGLSRGNSLELTIDKNNIVYSKHCPLTWSVDQLGEEIAQGVWEVMPTIPANENHLKQGSVIIANRDMPFIGLKAGQGFPIEYDGKLVKDSIQGVLSWSLDRLTEEINEGIWLTIGDS